MLEHLALFLFQFCLLKAFTNKIVLDARFQFDQANFLESKGKDKPNHNESIHKKKFWE